MKLMMRGNDLAMEMEADRLAYFLDGAMAALSFVATEATAKAIIASLQVCKKSTYLEREGQRGIMSLAEDGYRIMRAKLPRFNSVHVTAVAKRPGLVFGDKAAAVAAYLQSSSITTPILPEWVPHLVELLEKKELIAELTSYRFPAYLCEFSSEQLDELLARELQFKRLTIPTARRFAHV